MRTLTIFGKDQSDNVLDLDEFEIEVKLNEENKTIVKAVSNKLTVIGSTAKQLSDRFFVNCKNAVNVNIEAIFSDTKKNIRIPTNITFEDVEYCPDICKFETSLETINEEGTGYQFLNSYYFWQNGFLDKKLPFHWFTLQPGFLHYVIYAIRQIIVAVILVFFVAIAGGSIIGSILNPGSAVIAVAASTAIVLLKKLLVPVDNFISGNGRVNPVVIINDAIKYQCEKANLKWISSILESGPYSNAVIFSLEQGRSLSFNDVPERETDDIKAKIKEIAISNLPRWTVIELLENLKELFGGQEVCDYRIIRGTLYFETIDFFDSFPMPDIYDVQSLYENDELEDTPCYSFESANQYANADLRFSQDAKDLEGNKVLHLYSDRIEWNKNPTNDTQKGSANTLAKFGAARFMFDQETQRKDGFLDWERFIDRFRIGATGGILKTFFGNTGLVRSNDLILSGSQTSLPKILILENGFNFDDARTIKYPINTPRTEINANFEEIANLDLGEFFQYYYYNYPFFFKEDLPTEIGEKELYNNYHYKRNPRYTGPKERLSLKDMEFPMTKNAVRDILANGPGVRINTRYGIARAKSYILKFKKSLIEAKGMTIKC